MLRLLSGRDRKRRVEDRHGRDIGPTARKFEGCGAAQAMTDGSDPACVDAGLRDQRPQPGGHRTAEQSGISDSGAEAGVDVVHAQQLAGPDVVTHRTT